MIKAKLLNQRKDQKVAVLSEYAWSKSVAEDRASREWKIGH
jgi:hypothetical protein